MKSSVRLFDLRRGAWSDTPDRRFVLALGNFDGVHFAHRMLLSRAARLAKAKGLVGAAWCFDPPSSAFLGTSCGQLTTAEEKLTLFADCGLDYAFLADFPCLRSLSPEAFMEQSLCSDAHAAHLVCGFHFRFGNGGQGDVATLQQAFGHACVDVIPPVCIPVFGRETVVSASEARRALTLGDMATAARILGRPYSLTAPVVHGKQLGRTLGIPTINQDAPKNKLMPRVGIYATRVRIGKEEFLGVTNVGYRPTVDGVGTLLNLETHILGLDRDLYGQTVTVQFCQRLRDEQKFSSLDELKEAVQADIAATLHYFNR